MDNLKNGTWFMIYLAAFVSHFACHFLLRTDAAWGMLVSTHSLPNLTLKRALGLVNLIALVRDHKFTLTQYLCLNIRVHGPV